MLSYERMISIRISLDLIEKCVEMNIEMVFICVSFEILFIEIVVNKTFIRVTIS